MNNISDEFLFGEKIDMEKFKEKLIKEGNESEIHQFLSANTTKTKNKNKPLTSTMDNDRPCVITKQKNPPDSLASNLKSYQKTNPQVAKIEKLTLREKELLNMKKRKLLDEYRKNAVDEFNPEKNQSIMLS